MTSSFVNEQNPCFLLKSTKEQFIFPSKNKSNFKYRLSMENTHPKGKCLWKAFRWELWTPKLPSMMRFSYLLVKIYEFIIIFFFVKDLAFFFFFNSHTQQKYCYKYSPTKCQIYGRKSKGFICWWQHWYLDRLKLENIF